LRALLGGLRLTESAEVAGDSFVPEWRQYANRAHDNIHRALARITDDLR
jgi:hypothetical protein